MCKQMIGISCGYLPLHPVINSTEVPTFPRWACFRSVTFFVVTLISAILPVGITRGAEYTVTDLGTLGGAISTAYGLSGGGSAVGESLPAGVKPEEAFVYRDGTMTGLGTLPGGARSRAYGINEAGTIVGYAYLPELTVFQAFTYSNGVMRDLGTLGGPGSSAYAINQPGWIVGSADIESGSYRAFLYRDGMMTNLGTLGGDYSAAYDINDSGIVVGTSGNVAGNNRAFRFDGTMVDLGTLGGTTSEAYAVNASGIIVGSAQTTSGARRAFRYDGAMQDLGTLGGPTSFASDVNIHGVIVGSSPRVPGGDFHAFLYDGSMRDLNDLIPANSGWLLNYAVAINDRGQIVGNGRHNGLLRAFLLTPAAAVRYSVNPDGTIEITSGDNLSEAATVSGPFLDLGVKIVTIDPATASGNRFFRSESTNRPAVHSEAPKP